MFFAIPYFQVGIQSFHQCLKIVVGGVGSFCGDHILEK
jgi:hypothetical protein